MIRCVVFDLDGTILDTIEDIACSVNYALKTANLPVLDVLTIKSYIGDGVYRLMERATNNAPANIVQNCVVNFKTYYDIHKNDFTKPYAGICKLLNKLKERNIKIAVLSNKYQNAVKSLCEANFDVEFDEILGETPRFLKKPDEKALLFVLKSLGVKPENALVVGDSPCDIQCARAAGAMSVAVSWGFKDKNILMKEKPAFFIENPTEIINILQKNF